MSDQFAIWTPKFDGDAPPNWKAGMAWNCTTPQRECDQLVENERDPHWLMSCKYSTPTEALPAFDYPTWAAQGRANADKLPDGVAEALGPERDWADELAVDWFDDQEARGVESLAAAIRTRCRPIGNDTVTDEWLDGCITDLSRHGNNRPALRVHLRTIIAEATQ